MKFTWKPEHLIVVYFSILLALLLCVSTTPMLIRHGVSLTDRFIVKEDVIETAMILTLFGISFLILNRFMHRLAAYRRAVDTATREKSRLITRLTDAFMYIGKVNVEIREIESALCGIAFYPRNKKEFKQLVERFSSRAMTIAATPWLAVRIIDRHRIRTISEHTVRRPLIDLPTATLGNRALLDSRPVEGIRTIRSGQQNTELLTVFILPETDITDERTILLSAILRQIEMIFMIYRAGHHKPSTSTDRPC
jgi:hypothetical protein